MRHWATILLCTLAYSCTESGYVSVPESGWMRDDTLHIHCDSTCHSLILRLDRMFAYRQLHLRVNNRNSVTNVDTIRGVGLYEVCIPLPCADTVLHIAHHMRENPLRGIIAIGPGKY